MNIEDARKLANWMNSLLEVVKVKPAFRVKILEHYAAYLESGQDCDMVLCETWIESALKRGIGHDR